MTVINMLSLGSEGLAVADEQSSNYYRKFNIGEKLRSLGETAIYGGTGSSDMIRAVYDMSKERIDMRNAEGKPINLSEIYQILNNSLTETLYNRREDILRKNLSFGIKNLQTGKLDTGEEITPRAMDYASSLVGRRDELSVGVLIGGVQDGYFQIYQSDTQGPSGKVPIPYASIGSGSETSERILSEYFASLPREKREQIGLGEGLSKIIGATIESAALNHGVGGIPSIAYISEDGFFRPTEKACILSTELVKGLRGRFLKRGFVYETLEALVKEEEKPEKIQENMWKKAKKAKKFNLFLRNYK